MNRFMSVLALLAAPALAQDAPVYYASNTWPVAVTGRQCAMTAQGHEGSDPLTITYDAAIGEITLSAATSGVSTSLRDDSAVDMQIVFLGNSRNPRDDGWGERRFTFARTGDEARFTTRFAGERNVRQILADLANSQHVGLLYRGEVVTSTALASAGASLDKLQECGRRAVAAN